MAGLPGTESPLLYASGEDDELARRLADADGVGFVTGSHGP
jgi:hypothetical protein